MSKAFEIEGIDPTDFARGLKRLAKNAPKEFDNLLKQEATAILAEATPLAPVDTGKLKQSGQVDVHRKGYTVGFYTHYAAAVHEMGFGPATKGKIINFRVGGAKYLEKPYRKRKKDMAKRMKDKLMETALTIIRRNT